MSEEKLESNASSMVERACRWANLCGVTPFLLGMTIFLLWWKTSWFWFVNVEMLNVATGLLFVSFGLIYLIRFWILTQWMLSLRSPRKSRLILAGLALFAANFVGAAAVMLAVWVIQTAFLVEIRNYSNDTIRDAELVGGSCRFVFDRAIPHGGTSRCIRWIKHDDQCLVLNAQGDYQSFYKTFNCDVRPNLGGFHSIIIKGHNSMDLDPFDGGD